jgi:beta-xylosidase
VWAVVLAAALAGCGSGSDTPAATSSPAAGSSAAAETFTNPVYDENFPDPGVLRVGEDYYAYGTNNSGANVPTLTSPDLVSWTPGPDAMPDVGKWAVGGNTWAPEVIAVGRRYVLYYTARSVATGKQCIGRAVAAEPTGPFADPAPEPLVCEVAEGGSIDASPFRDRDGKLYLHWKNDGNCCGKPVRLYARPLSSDGLRLTGTRTTLLTNTKPWQGNLVESPEMVRHGSDYVLFYSANAYDSDKYAVGYARCRSAVRPCSDTAEPVLKSSGEAAGPGHPYVVTDDGGQTWLLYHAWPPEAIGSTSPGRQLWLDRLEWEGGRPVVRGPTATPQPEPEEK